MTDPDQPFRRPSHSDLRDDAGEVTNGEVIPQETGSRAEPLILDPELHPSVWKAWEAPKRPNAEDHGTDDAVAEDVPEPPIQAKHSVARLSIIAVSFAGVLALVAALLLPRLLVPVAALDAMPFVEDMFTQPEIAWTAEGGDPCYPYLDEDHVVLTGTDRVRSLDLRDGTTTWSASFHGRRVEASCLPGAHLVAVTERDAGSDEVLGITLLNGSTGKEVSEFPGESTQQVVALGPNVGILDTSNTLRAFAPDRLDAPLWSRILPGPPEALNHIFVQPVDDTSVMLWYSTVHDSGDGSDFFTPVLSLRDGKSPPWFQGVETDQQYYQPVGDVMGWRSLNNDEGSKFAVVDLKGRELWSVDDTEAYIIGPRLYVATAASDSEESWTKELREVDPRTGSPLGADVFTGQFDFATVAPDGRIALFEYNSMTILDEQLQEQVTIPITEYGSTFTGEKLLYVLTYETPSTSRGKRLLALDATGSRLWTLDLELTQEVQQMGRHLVVVDDYPSAIHGLSNTS